MCITTRHTLSSIKSLKNLKIWSYWSWNIFKNFKDQNLNKLITKLKNVDVHTRWIILYGIYTYYEGFVETNILCTRIIVVGRITVIIIIIIITHGLRYKGSPARWVATKIMYDYYWAGSTLVLRDFVIIILILTCEHHVTIPSAYRIIIKVKS